MVDKKAKKVAETKVKVVSEFTQLIKEYPIVAAINMANLPAKQLQQMRATLRNNNCVLKMTKRRLIIKAIEKSKDANGIDQLVPFLKGMPALLFTNENPFKLYKMLEKSKSKAPAKAGQIAPSDIIVKAGPTGFAPGPIISELGQVGIKAGIEDGKVVVKADSLVLKEGDEVNAQVAGILSRLGVEPMEIGLAITAVLEDGTIYKKDVLAIDEDEFMAKVMNAAASTFNLAVEVGYLCTDTVEVLVQKAYNDSKALALETNFMADAVVDNVLAKAEAQASSLKAKVNQ